MCNICTQAILAVQSLFVSTPRDQLIERLRSAQAALQSVDPTQALAAVEQLSQARAAVDAALDEALALAALEGESLRTIAVTANLAPNSVPPRLGRSASLGNYGADGKVGSRGVERARYDRERGDYEPASKDVEPLRFQRRKRTKDS